MGRRFKDEVKQVFNIAEEICSMRHVNGTLVTY